LLLRVGAKNSAVVGEQSSTGQQYTTHNDNDRYISLF
jgi:hypothetical protein